MVHVTAEKLVGGETNVTELVAREQMEMIVLAMDTALMGQVMK